VLRNGVLRRDVAGFAYSETPPRGRHTYAVAALDTSGNVGPAAVALMPSATNGSSVAKPRNVLLSRKHRGRLVTMRFLAKGATGMRAYRGARRIARSGRDRVSVTTRVPRRGRRARRARVRVVASSWAGERVKHFTIR
jgi:hypothetical protein